MQIAVFSTKSYDREFLTAANVANGGRHELQFLSPALGEETAVLAVGCAGVCAFVNDRLDAPTLGQLALGGTRFVALRCAGFDQVDLAAAASNGIIVVRVPAYSPHAIAEHAIALILALNRRIPRAFSRVREGNFSLDGLLGFNLHGRVAGIVGTGQIGAMVAQILQGFGCTVLAIDPRQNTECLKLGIAYVTWEELLSQSDIISLHCPLDAGNHRLIDHAALQRMKPGVMLINTSRGGLLDTAAAIDALKSGRLGYLGLDVYEAEKELFFEDLSSTILPDDVFSRLLTFPNVLITGHQGFFTREAMETIAATTIANLSALETGGHCENAIALG